MAPIHAAAGALLVYRDPRLPAVWHERRGRTGVGGEAGVEALSWCGAVGGCEVGERWAVSLLQDICWLNTKQVTSLTNWSRLSPQRGVYVSSEGNFHPCSELDKKKHEVDVMRMKRKQGCDCWRQTHLQESFQHHEALAGSISFLMSVQEDSFPVAPIHNFPQNRSRVSAVLDSELRSTHVSPT